MPKKELTPDRLGALLGTLKVRFERNAGRHKGIEWTKMRARLERADAGKLWLLGEMERTGGEPDVVCRDKRTGECVFFDCSAESPKSRRSVCYDSEGREARTEVKPKGSAVGMAAAMGAELLTEGAYRVDARFTGLALAAKFAVWPLAMLAIVAADAATLRFFGTEIHRVMLLLSMVPLAANTVAFATELRSQPEKAAFAVLASTIVALFYVPALSALLLAAPV